MEDFSLQLFNLKNNNRTQKYQQQLGTRHNNNKALLWCVVSFVTVLVATCSVDTMVIERNTGVLIKNGLCYLLLCYINTWDYLLLLFERLAAYSSSKNQTRARLQCSVVNIIENNNCLHLSLKSSYKSVKVNYSFPALRRPKSYPKSDPHSNLPCNVHAPFRFFFFLNFICICFAYWMIANPWLTSFPQQSCSFVHVSLPS